MQVPLGVQLKNEQVTSQMVEIMDALHKYVPTKKIEMPYTNEEEGVSGSYTEDHMVPLLFGGDQLTCARARSSQLARKNSNSKADALLGLIPCCEDWHAKVMLLTVRSFEIVTGYINILTCIPAIISICCPAGDLEKIVQIFFLH